MNHDCQPQSGNRGNHINNNNNLNNTGFICGVIEGFYGKPWNFEQRKDLFKRLKDLNLNSFLYAPKDDVKHRARWRQLYSPREADELRILIEEAKANGIDFYYSLAPGLDMVYSDPEELERVLRKYDQIVGLGCKSFAILFDDIEPTLNDKDKGIFEHYASAQVSITNAVYEHLNEPKFLFCPTEYCESRAVPNVTDSIYLNTLGSGLRSGIDFLWSGSRVISRFITEESMETLAKVIKRPPLIWENLHANDYDKKRVFLGPYSGRSTKIIPKIRGVLTNPNCEYEANYVAIHTLAQWSRCSDDINLHNRCNPDNRVPESEINMTRAKSIEQGQFDSDCVYNPDKALIHAIKDWLPHLLEYRPLPSGINLVSRQRSDELANDNLAKDHEDVQNQLQQQQELKPHVVDEDIDVVDMVSADESQSPAGSAGASSIKSEMDISGPVGTQSGDRAVSNLVETNSCDSCEMQDITLTTSATASANTTAIATASLHEGQAMSEKLKPSEICIDCVMCSSRENAEKNQKILLDANSTNAPTGTAAAGRHLLNFDNLSLLVDLFYLPFEHGSRGYSLLRDIQWLRENSEIVLMTAADRQQPERRRQQDQVNNNKEAVKEGEEEAQMRDDNDEEEIDGNRDNQRSADSKLTVEIWLERAEKLNNLCTCINQLVQALIVSY